MTSKPEPTDAELTTPTTEPFFSDMDSARRQPGGSCCTVWTLGLLLWAILVLGLWLIFH